MSTPYKQTLEKSIAVPRVQRHVVLGILGAALFAGLTFVGAHIRIPLQPVPITLQTLFVLMAGAMLGRRFGALSQFVYVAVGAMGLPVFAESLSGLGVIAGPTGGYLIGFVLAPLFVGAFVDRKPQIAWNMLVFFCGSLVILSLGVLHLTVFYTHDLWESLKLGYFPFIPGDILKILAAASIYRSYQGLRSLASDR